jgi:hypothetical protein
VDVTGEEAEGRSFTANGGASVDNACPVHSVPFDSIVRFDCEHRRVDFARIVRGTGTIERVEQRTNIEDLYIADFGPCSDRVWVKARLEVGYGSRGWCGTDTVDAANDRDGLVF